LVEYAAPTSFPIRATNRFKAVLRSVRASAAFHSACNVAHFKYPAAFNQSDKIFWSDRLFFDGDLIQFLLGRAVEIYSQVEAMIRRRKFGSSRAQKGTLLRQQRLS
jgi:hypothetical protein